MAVDVPPRLHWQGQGQGQRQQLQQHSRLSHELPQSHRRRPLLPNNPNTSNPSLNQINPVVWRYAIAVSTIRCIRQMGRNAIMMSTTTMLLLLRLRRLSLLLIPPTVAMPMPMPMDAHNLSTTHRFPPRQVPRRPRHAVDTNMEHTVLNKDHRQDTMRILTMAIAIATVAINT
jgi:hypothetical protein